MSDGTRKLAFQARQYGKTQRYIENLESELAARDAEIADVKVVLQLCRGVLDLFSMDTPPVHYAMREIDSVLDSPATQAAVNRVRADAVESAMQKIINEANAEDEVERSASLFDAAFILEDYANTLRNPDQANREE